MRRITFSLVLVLLLVFCYSPVIAKDNYVVIKAGKYLPTGDLDDEGFDNAFTGEVAAGHNFTPNFGVEFGIGHFETDASHSYYIPEDDNLVEKDTVSITPVTVTVRGIIPAEKMSVYAGIGAGIYFVSGEIDFILHDVTLSLEDDDRVLGVHALVGFEYNFTPETFIGIEAKHTWTEEAEFRDSIAGIPFEAETNLDGFNIMAKIGCRF